MTSAISPPEPQFLYLTTRGRKTGLPREIEIWFVTHDGRFYVLAERGRNAQWVRNVLAHPGVHVRVSDREFPAVARVLDAERDETAAQTVRRLSEQKYGWGGGITGRARSWGIPDLAGRYAFFIEGLRRLHPQRVA